MEALLRPGCVFFLTLACAAVLAGASPDTGEIARLIEQLGDDDHDVRQAAEKKLHAIGEPALAALRRAARGHADPDVRLRARAVERALFGEVRAFVGHSGAIRCIAVSRDGKRALTGGMDGTARLWDLASGKELRRFTGHHDAPARDGKWVWSLAFSPDEKFVISSGAMDRTLRLWGVADGKELRKFEGHQGWVYAADFSPDGKYVLSSGAGDDSKDYTVRLWDAATGKEVRRFEGHSSYVMRAIFSPDGKKIASVGGADRTFRVWDVSSGRLLVLGAGAHDGVVVGVAFSPDGRHLLTCGRDLTCKRWETATGRLVSRYTGASNHVEAVAFSKDGRRWLAAEKGAVQVFEVETGKWLHRFDEHTGAVLAVAWLPDGAHALSGGEDQTLRLWRVPR